MRYEITSESIAGFSTQSAVPGQTLLVAVRGFYAPEDGSYFYDMLDQISAHFLGPYLDGGYQVSTIDHCLIFLSAEGKASVYVNDLPIVLTCVMRRPVNAGEPVMKSDIGAITEFRLSGITVPEKSAILFYFSVN